MYSVILIDGTSLCYRAYHALGELKNSKGVKTGAIFGFCSMIKTLVMNYPQTPLVLFFDKGGKNFRHDLYPLYKANRQERPQDLSEQLATIYEISNYLGMPVIAQEGTEADDLIGTVANRYQNLGKVLISTSDKDFCQLINDRIFLEVEEKKKKVIVDREHVFTKYNVYPEQFRDYLALLGDASDHIPGVPLIGKVTAANLLKKYQSLASILQEAVQIPGKVGQNLAEYSQQALLAQQLVTIDTNIAWPTELDINTLPPMPAPNLVKLHEIYQDLEFKSLLPKPALVQKIQAPTVIVHPITTLLALDELKRKLYASSLIAIDLETSSLDPKTGSILGVGLSFEEGSSYYISFTHGDDGLYEQFGLFWQDIALDNSKTWVGHNIKFDFSFLLQAFSCLPVHYEDTMIMSYVLQPLGPFDLKSLALQYLNWPLTSYEELVKQTKGNFADLTLEQSAEYGAYDAQATFLLYEQFALMLRDQPAAAHVYQTIDRPFIRVLMLMELNGVLLDTEDLNQIAHDLKIQLGELEEQIYQQAGKPFNINSTKQLREVLFEQLGLATKNKTPKGEFSTNEDVLYELSSVHPIAQLLLDYRHLEKIRSTYTLNLIEQISSATGRLHTHYHQTGTITGRLSSSDPNLQNIPIKSAWGEKIRRAFKARPGYILLSADYSQIELRLMAHYSKDAELVRAYRSAEDIHARTAASLYGCSLQEVTSEQRRFAKTINFGLIYGMSPWGLAKQLKIDQNIATNFFDAYFATYPAVKTYMESMKNFAQSHGYVVTLCGRKIPLRKSAKESLTQNDLRAAINGPLQGSASDLMKLGMLAVQKEIDAADEKIYLLMQVHDEIVLEVPKESASIWAEKVKKCLTEAMRIDVPLEVDVTIDHCWS